ncbi:DUF3347 domain-containing protein [Pseudoflavitalea sp. G-6-1-2]|uniref:DUF3347 domain-containing protein n=1 Tax=Pseudoflavitalea sp. G-6-1-2 TaxID=2728841 RepID=UPI00146CEAA4|nr:DUF3347 domain-containing protein [Pseudoflavitalea sp. G-6-1-2]NML21356.1 DUF3347 domain-containing protein [Pseudoflavitalea sp. G-6-1-2]
MKSIIGTSLVAIAVLAFAACGNGNNNADAPAKTDSTEHTDHTGHNHAAEKPAEQTKTAGVQIKDDMLNAVYQQYAALTAALVESDAAKAKVAANAIEAGAKELKGAEAIAAAAAKITTAKDIDAQRIAYSDLSNNLITLVKKSGINSGELYVEFCPMAMNDKGGYWISNDKAIKNPYFGASMLTCGDVKETLQ